MSKSASRSKKGNTSRSNKQPEEIIEENVEASNLEEGEGTEEHQFDQTKQNMLDTGFGRFEYQNGTIYEGQWKEIDGAKMKHGEGYLVHAGLSDADGVREEYKGTWKEDQMDGFGIYKYISGAVYTGEWKENKHHGKGVYEFPDGSVYEGEWKDHRMNGEGSYTDKDNRKWVGEFVEGVFQSKLQKKLKFEKVIKRKKGEVMESVVTFFEQFFGAYESSEKKTYKENLSGFFPSKNSDDLRVHLREPFPKYEDRKPDAWYEMLKFVSEGKVTILQKSSQSRFIDSGLILTKQFMGLGQIVEYENSEEGREAKLSLCKLGEDRWMVVFHELTEEKQGKK